MRAKYRRRWGINYSKLYLCILVAWQMVMPYIVYTEYIRRGYLAFGGEWFAPLVVIVIIEAIRLAKETYKEDYE